MTIKKNPQASALNDAESLSSAAVQQKGTAQAKVFLWRQPNCSPFQRWATLGMEQGISAVAGLSSVREETYLQQDAY